MPNFSPNPQTTPHQQPLQNLEEEDYNQYPEEVA